MSSLLTNTGAGPSIEDAEHATLVQAVNDFRFAVANSNLLKVLDGTLGAKAPAEPEAAALTAAAPEAEKA